MEQKLGYSLINSKKQEIEFWNYEPAPNPIILPNGNHVHSPELNVSYSGYKLVERWEISNNDTNLVRTADRKISFDGNRVIVDLVYRNPDQSELLQYSSNKRYETEISGITVNDVLIDTSRQSQSMLTGIMGLMNIDANATINFKTSGGSFIKANASTMKDISLAVASHVQTCFSTEDEVASSIANNSITSFAEIDAVYLNINKKR